MKTYLPLLRFMIILGFIVFLFSGFTLVKVYFNIEGIIAIDLTGSVSLGGYIFLIFFHVLVFIVDLIFRFGSGLKRFSNYVVFFNVISLVSVGVQRIMYHKIGSALNVTGTGEYAVLFIYFGILANMICVFYICKFIFKRYNYVKSLDLPFSDEEDNPVETYK